MTVGIIIVPISQMRKLKDKRWSEFPQATHLVNNCQAKTPAQPGCPVACTPPTPRATPPNTS